MSSSIRLALLAILLNVLSCHARPLDIENNEDLPHIGVSSKMHWFCRPAEDASLYEVDRKGPMTRMEMLCEDLSPYMSMPWMIGPLELSVEPTEDAVTIMDQMNNFNTTIYPSYPVSHGTLAGDGVMYMHLHRGDHYRGQDARGAFDTDHRIPIAIHVESHDCSIERPCLAQHLSRSDPDEDYLHQAAEIHIDIRPDFGQHVEPMRLSVVYHRKNNYIMTVQERQLDNPKHDEAWPHFPNQISRRDLPSPDTSLEISPPDTSLETSFVATTEDNSTTLDDEITLLRDLEDLKSEIQTRIDIQRQRVHDLEDAESAQPSHQFKECSNFGCLLSVAFTKAAHGFKMACLKFGPHRNHALFATAPTSDLQQAMLAPDGMQHLSDKVSAESCSNSSTSSNSILATSASFRDQYPNAFLALDVLAGIICLSALLSCLHRCVSPRARAERAATREMRRTQREYRSLARRHAFRRLWSKICSRRTDERRITDYEEKRALVLGQEGRLEEAMQGHIAVLQRPASLSDTLPAYRSRASSAGRPPSYHSTDSAVESAPEPDVVDGFARYVPREFPVDDEQSASMTDTSVVNLSPRQSHESLRSVASFV